jgi:peptidyl-tRNA hydrolase, PTH1 family
MLVDALANAEGVRLDRLQHNAAVARTVVNNKKLILAKPMTFMNNSGESVGKLQRFYKVRCPLCSGSM